MAYEFYVSIEGTKQGQFKGESTREAHKDKLAGIGFSYEVKSPRDVATGQASGKRQHGPVTFTKEWGAASPQLFTALVSNETLKGVLFEFMHTNDSGEEEVKYTIKLTSASVTGIRQYIDAGAAQGSEAIGTSELEDIELVFRSIEIESKAGKTSASDSLQR